MVESTGLENRRTRKGLVGSNPTLPAPKPYAAVYSASRGADNPTRASRIRRATSRVSSNVTAPARSISVVLISFHTA